MSWQATAWALRQKTGSSGCKLLLLTLANYADDTGCCWPGQVWRVASRDILLHVCDFCIPFDQLKRREFITLLGGAADQAIDLVDRFAGCFRDHRRQDLIEHAVTTLIGQRVFGIALGIEYLLRSKSLPFFTADEANWRGDGLAPEGRLTPLKTSSASHTPCPPAPR